jgi:hypothetical protein
MGADELKSGHVSVNDVLHHYDTFAIPHFQRGLVWNSSAVASLLESLYLGTPCGSFLLWAPADATEHGVPVAGSAAAKYLIIDGQQRIRSLRSVFADDDDLDLPASGGEGLLGEDEAGADDSGGDTEDTDGRKRAVWCLNLARLDEFRSFFDPQERFRLFGLHADPLTPGDVNPRQPYRKALVPLAWFLKHRSNPDRARDESRGTHCADAVVKLLALPKVVAQLSAIRTARLFDLRILDAEQNLDSVVSAFNRINSAGKRVESEERAFATLVSVNARTEQKLKEFFRRTRGREPGAAAVEADLERDDLVRREKESRFGFKLFMRVFALAFAYHSNKSAGSQGLSFDSLDVGSLREARQHLDEILDSTVEVLSAVTTILRNRLYCDDFRMLPETSSLWPVFQLLIRFPALATTSENQVAAVILRLMLVDVTRDQLLRLVKEVAEAADSQEAMAAFDSDELGHPVVTNEIAEGVERAQSLTNRYALMMYWLLRRRGARDFSYDINLTPEKTAELRKKHKAKTEPEIAERVRPEKQHVVPYSTLKDIFGDRLSGPRLGRHEAHNVGNLTYISQLENGLEGLGSRPLKLREEGRPNLVAHFLDGNEILEAFETACKERATPEHFEEFCKLRRDRIRQAFVEWDIEFRRLPVSASPPETPAPRLIRPTPKDLMWQLGYQKPIPGLLVQLLNLGFRVRQGKDVALRLVLRSKADGQTVRVDLFHGGKKIECKVSDPTLIGEWKQRFPSVHVNDRTSDLKETLGLTDDSSVRVAANVLEWLRDRAAPIVARGQA